MHTLAELTKQDEDQFQLRSYAKWPLALERGEGCWVFDSDGNRYLDFYGGHAVVATGHCHPKIVEAIQQQAARLIFYSNVVYNSQRGRAVRRLIESAGLPYVQAFLANSGSEANENAIKLARALTARKEIISITGSFHGRGYASLSSTGIEKYSKYLNTPVPHHTVIPIEQAAERITTGTAGVLIEPIQSLSGVRVLPVEHLRSIRDKCLENGALLMFDEVQTGVGRTGRFLYSGIEGVFPDVVTLAKGIASGFPASAVLVTEKVAREVKSGDLGTTFGGGPLACAAIEATMDVIAAEKLVENAREVGSYLSEELARIAIVETVRGAGLLLGVRMKPPFDQAKTVRQALFEKRILTGTSDDPAFLRLMPPLTLSREQAQLLIQAVASL